MSRFEKQAQVLFALLFIWIFSKGDGEDNKAREELVGLVNEALFRLNGVAPVRGTKMTALVMPILREWLKL